MSRSRTAAELLVVYALLVAMLWRAFGDRGPAPALCGVAIAAVVLASWRRTGATPASLGLAPAAWRSGWPSAAAASLGGLALLGVAGIATGHASLAAARFAWLGDYALGIAGQQLLLQGFFAPGFARLAASRPPAIPVGAAALAFAALHAPNPGLMAGTAVAGAFWVAHFRRHHNLPAVLASHLVLGLAAMASLGPGPLWNLRVGAGALDLMAR